MFIRYVKKIVSITTLRYFFCIIIPRITDCFSYLLVMPPLVSTNVAYHVCRTRYEKTKAQSGKNSNSDLNPGHLVQKRACYLFDNSDAQERKWYDCPQFFIPCHTTHDETDPWHSQHTCSFVNLKLGITVFNNTSVFLLYRVFQRSCTGSITFESNILKRCHF